MLADEIADTMLVLTAGCANSDVGSVPEDVDLARGAELHGRSRYETP